jgi:hypothetical protein
VGRDQDRRYPPTHAPGPDRWPTSTLCYHRAVLQQPRTADPEVIRACVARVIESGVLGRGHIHPKLLRYLADRTIRGEVPKEFDISVDVFGKAKGDVDAPDAQTRVHIYKLRARLDAYYAGAGKHDALRLEIPKGTYHLCAVANENLAAASASAAAPAIARRPMARYGIAGLLVALVLSVGTNLAWLTNRAPPNENRVADSQVWAAFNATSRPVLLIVGDHFFFGESGTHLRSRDIRINSRDELLSSAEYASASDLVFETLSYLPKSTAFALQTLLPKFDASRKTVSMKLISELTAEDLRDHDLVYVGFVRAMATWRDYFLGKSNFTAEPPLFMSFARKDGEVFMRSGPVPRHNRDYGIVARFTGPTGNEIVVLTGIGDVGVLAAVRAAGTEPGIRQIEAELRAAEVDVGAGFEVLVEADGHSRMDLGARVVGAYALGSSTAAPPVTRVAEQTIAPAALDAAAR